MGLKEIISIVEKDIGLISITNKTIEKGHTNTIPFALKPSEQLISALRGPKDTHLPIVNAPHSVKTFDNKDVTIKGFTTKTAQQTLTISGTRLDRLLSSAKIYVNTNVFPDGLYQKMNVAKEFPDLNIIYHPADHENTFDKALKNAKLENVAKASKNIIFMADKLTRMGKPCALHMPTHSDVLYGLSDESSQTYMGTVSTSAVNSFSLNPQAFATVVERNLTCPTNSVIKTEISDNKNNINLPKPSCVSEEYKVEQITKHEEKLTLNANSTDAPPLVEQIDEKIKETATPPSSDEIRPATIFSLVQIEQEPPVPLNLNQDKLETSQTTVQDQLQPPTSELPIQNTTDEVIVISSPGNNGMFPPSKAVETPPRLEPTSSSLSKKQILEINHTTIDCLTGEIQSCWPYPNKALKQIKVDALNALIKNARTMNIHDAIAAVKQEYPKAIEGNWSTRTADLFNKLERQSIAVNSMN